MSVVAIAFLFAIGASAWVYTKMEHRLGEVNMKSIMLTVGVCFVLIFVMVFALLKYGFSFS